MGGSGRAVGAARRVSDAIARNKLMLAALAVFVVLRAPVMLHGYLYVDDIIFRFWAHTSPLDLNYLFRPHNGHVNPVGLLGQWALQRAFPGSVTAIMWYSLAWQVLGLAVVWRLMVELTGRQGSAVIAFTIGAFSLFTFEVGVWWACAIYAGPFTVFLLLAVLFLTRALSGQGGVWWTLSVVAYAVCLLSFSRAAVGLVLLLAVASALPIWPPNDARAGSRGLRRALRAKPDYWVALFVLTGGYVALLLAIAEPAQFAAASPVAVAGNALRTLMFSVVPATVGGPWTWLTIQGVQWPFPVVQPAQHMVLPVVSAIVLVGAIIMVGLFRRALLAFLIWTGVFIGIVIVAAAATRPFVPLNYRYIFDVWMPIAILFGLGPYPLKHEVNPFTPRARRLAADYHLTRRRSATVALACAAFAASAGLSHIVPVTRWVTSETKRYMESGIDSFSAMDAPNGLLPQFTPPDLIHPYLMQPYGSSVVVFSPVPGSPQFSNVANNALFSFDGAGNLQRSQFAARHRSVPPPTPYGYAWGNDPVRIPLESPSDLLQATVEIRYAVDADAIVELTGASGSVVVTLPSGFHTSYFRMPGVTSELTVRVVDGGLRGGIDSLALGVQLDSQGQPVSGASATINAE